MKLAVVGSRKFNDYTLLRKELSMYDNIEEIVSGGAKGADALAERYAREVLKIEPTVFRADWKRWGKRAGPLRNQKIWEYADQGIAFWDGFSPGTKDSIDWANFHRKKVKIVRIKEDENS
jgi:hypothetical protein